MQDTFWLYLRPNNNGLFFIFQWRLSWERN